MIRTLACLLLSLPLLAGCAALPPAQAASEALPQTAPMQLPNLRQWDMRAANGRDYRLFIAAPQAAAPETGYPVFYVLDANHLFLTVVETVRAFERRPDSPPGMGAVIVGIGYPDGVDTRLARTLDLTPVPSDSPRLRGPSGGGDAFLAFIRDELKPAVAQLVAVDPQRQAIFGHSFGGLFVLHALVSAPETFQTYIAASPSLWYGEGVMGPPLVEFAQARNAADPPLRVLITAGEYEQSPAPGVTRHHHARDIHRDLAARAQVDQGAGAARVLNAAPGIEARFDRIDGEDHGSVVPAAISRATSFLLKPYQREKTRP